MTLARTTTGINKAEDAGRMDSQIGFADTLRRIFPTALASYLQFRGWICRETLCGRSSVTIYLRQCAGRTNCRLSPGSRGRPSPPRRDRECHPRPEVRRGAQSSPLGALPRQRRLAGRPGHGPQPSPLDNAHRPGRAGADHQDPPTTLPLSRRTAHPQGAPPHPAPAPHRWPWQNQFSSALARLRALPLPS